MYWNEEIYKSNIQDAGENYISISIPVSQGRYLPLEKGDKIEAIYYEKLNLYKFESIVLGRKIENNVPQIFIDVPKIFIKIQRRNYVRVDTVEYIKYKKITNKYSLTDKVINDESDYQKAMLLDISGGGMKIKVKEDLKIGDFILADLFVEEVNIKVAGKVVRSEKDEDNGKVCGIRFEQIDASSREKIIRYVFNIMRKQRKAALKEG